MRTIAIFFGFLFIAQSAFAGTIRVPTDQPNIQSGITAAVDGDTVLVAPGTYTGAGNRDVNCQGKAVSLISESGPVVTIIDCDSLGRAFIFENGEGQYEPN